MLGREGGRQVYNETERREEVYYGTKSRKEVHYVAMEQKQGKRCTIYGRSGYSYFDGYCNGCMGTYALEFVPIP